MTATQAGVEPARATVEVALERDAARITVRGALTAELAERFSDVCDGVLSRRPARMELDLSAVTESSEPAALAVARCLSLGRLLDEGVGVTVHSDAGRAVLLASLASV